MLGWQRIGILLFGEEQFTEEKRELDFQAATKVAGGSEQLLPDQCDAEGQVLPEHRGYNSLFSRGP